jgi:hypothetical protein
MLGIVGGRDRNNGRLKNTRNGKMNFSAMGGGEERAEDWAKEQILVTV